MCKKGFTANPKTGQCENIDECDQNLCGKDAECKDTVGSFMCVCKDGKTLDDKGLNCEGEFVQ